ncbi:uncharacterized protein LOC141832534 [Curcuma longa]|uniref:uncharacterized protein LOC141832534 n=1 Tax=Curcuma longa TaxID=136217 RepID=UPI003D9E14F6
MPKERRRRSRSMDHYRCRASPLIPSTSSSRSAPDSDDDKKWGDVRCPICMEHPHNAVLLQCSSRDKGCHTFICDTSYRHSNCLDQYRKSSFSNQSPEEDDNLQPPPDMSCPLCRGRVTGWTVIEPARKYMNAKSRSCSLESCSFTGVYGELREHARREHPSARPSEADPVRQEVWRSMERQRDLGDMFSVQYYFHSPAVTGEADSLQASTLQPPSRSSRSRTSLRDRQSSRTSGVILLGETVTLITEFFRMITEFDREMDILFSHVHE